MLDQWRQNPLGKIRAICGYTKTKELFGNQEIEPCQGFESGDAVIGEANNIHDDEDDLGMEMGSCGIDKGSSRGEVACELEGEESEGGGD